MDGRLPALRHPEWTGDGIIIDQRGKRDLVLLPALGTETSIYQKEPTALDSTVQVQLQSVDLPSAKLTSAFPRRNTSSATHFSSASHLEDAAPQPISKFPLTSELTPGCKLPVEVQI